MKGLRTGLGSVFWAAFGLLFGLMLLGDWWVGPMVGAAVGLIIGAVADLMGSGDPADQANEYSEPGGTETMGSGRPAGAS